MKKSNKLDEMYMDIAVRNSQMSNGIRAKVGAVLVTENLVLLTGWNGTHPGGDNRLEYVDQETCELITKREVIHAELNCILKAAREGVSVKSSTIYVTHAPCLPCSAMLVSVGVSRVVYKQIMPHHSEGVLRLKQFGVQCDHHIM